MDTWLFTPTLPETLGSVVGIQRRNTYYKVPVPAPASGWLLIVAWGVE